MGRLPELQEAYQGRAVVSLVYIAEAHASDQWPVGPSISRSPAPRSVADRLALARGLVARAKAEMPGWRLPVLVDTMDDGFLEAFAAWPLRFFVLENGKVVYKAQPREDDCLYHLSDLRAWLDGYLATKPCPVKV